MLPDGSVAEEELSVDIEEEHSTSIKFLEAGPLQITKFDSRVFAPLQFRTE